MADALAARIAAGGPDDVAALADAWMETFADGATLTAVAVRTTLLPLLALADDDAPRLDPLLVHFLRHVPAVIPDVHAAVIDAVQGRVTREMAVTLCERASLVAIGNETAKVVNKTWKTVVAYAKAHAADDEALVVLAAQTVLEKLHLCATAEPMGKTAVTFTRFFLTQLLALADAAAAAIWADPGCGRALVRLLDGTHAGAAESPVLRFLLPALDSLVRSGMPPDGPNGIEPDAAPVGCLVLLAYVSPAAVLDESSELVAALPPAFDTVRDALLVAMAAGAREPCFQWPALIRVHVVHRAALVRQLGRDLVAFAYRQGAPDVRRAMTQAIVAAVARANAQHVQCALADLIGCLAAFGFPVLICIQALRRQSGGDEAAQLARVTRIVRALPPGALSAAVALPIHQQSLRGAGRLVQRSKVRDGVAHMAVLAATTDDAASALSEQACTDLAWLASTLGRADPAWFAERPVHFADWLDLWAQCRHGIGRRDLEAVAARLADLVQAADPSPALADVARAVAMLGDRLESLDGATDVLVGHIATVLSTLLLSPDWIVALAAARGLHDFLATCPRSAARMLAEHAAHVARAPAVPHKALGALRSRSRGMPNDAPHSPHNHAQLRGLALVRDGLALLDLPGDVKARVLELVGAAS